MSIGENIKRLREIHGLSQEQLGDIVGLTDKAVSTWELGIKTPKISTIEKIAKYFNITISNIVETSAKENLFVYPEKPFIIFYRIKGVRDYNWCESEEEVKEIITDYREQFGKDFCLEDGIEISGCRELRIE